MKKYLFILSFLLVGSLIFAQDNSIFSSQTNGTFCGNYVINITSPRENVNWEIGKAYTISWEAIWPLEQQPPLFTHCFYKLYLVVPKTSLLPPPKSIFNPYTAEGKYYLTSGLLTTGITRVNIKDDIHPVNHYLELNVFGYGTSGELKTFTFPGTITIIKSSTDYSNISIIQKDIKYTIKTLEEALSLIQNPKSLGHLYVAFLDLYDSLKIIQKILDEGNLSINVKTKLKEVINLLQEAQKYPLYSPTFNTPQNKELVKQNILKAVQILQGILEGEQTTSIDIDQFQVNNIPQVIQLLEEIIEKLKEVIQLLKKI